MATSGVADREPWSEYRCSAFNYCRTYKYAFTFRFCCTSVAHNAQQIGRTRYTKYFCVHNYTKSFTNEIELHHNKGSPLTGLKSPYNFTVAAWIVFSRLNFCSGFFPGSHLDQSNLRRNNTVFLASIKLSWVWERSSTFSLDSEVLDELKVWPSVGTKTVSVTMLSCSVLFSLLFHFAPRKGVNNSALLLGSVASLSFIQWRGDRSDALKGDKIRSLFCFFPLHLLQKEQNGFRWKNVPSIHVSLEQSIKLYCSVFIAIVCRCS